MTFLDRRGRLSAEGKSAEAAAVETALQKLAAPDGA
jgi:hypothetical protein